MLRISTSAPDYGPRARSPGGGLPFVDGHNAQFQFDCRSVVIFMLKLCTGAEDFADFLFHALLVHFEHQVFRRLPFKG